jgi:hypothetical protein
MFLFLWFLPFRRSTGQTQSVPNDSTGTVSLKGPSDLFVNVLCDLLSKPYLNNTWTMKELFWVAPSGEKKSKKWGSAVGKLKR